MTHHTIRPWRLSRPTAFVAVILLLALAACRREPPADDAAGATEQLVTAVTQNRQPSATPTASRTPLPSATPAPTATPTITPTPTATAPLAIVEGNPLARAVHDAAPQAGAPCGMIDLLDFPVDPPDALNVSRGGQDFNVFRNRYDGYHAGEDWWGPGGRGGTFGEPVYSIGHGQVTFAHPYGWGIDQGTVILRHVYPDGSEFYSFYGHLDPPSITLNYGQCVTRGQKIGEIGRPRGAPHLHFEMRYHTPSDPGPGYWSHDPRRSGWLAPSHTIWSWRMAVSPGVLWQRADFDAGLLGISYDAASGVVGVTGPHVAAYHFQDGAQRWRFSTAADPTLEEEQQRPIAATARDEQQNILYAADRRGRMMALSLPAPAAEGQAMAEPQLLWDLQLYRVSGAPHLIPLPNGGVALNVDGRMIAFSATGNLLWRKPFTARPVSWVVGPDATLVSASGDGGSLWQVSSAGLSGWQANTYGKLVATGSAAYLYDGSAIYQVDPLAQTMDRFLQLSVGVASQGDLLALSDGRLLLAHHDGLGRRLLNIAPDGSLHWQRAFNNQFDGAPRLLLSGNQPYLFSEQENGSWTRVFLHRIDLQSERLTLIFSGGTRTPLPGATWILPAEVDQFFINIGGGPLLAFDARSALEVACGGAASSTC